MLIRRFRNNELVTDALIRHILTWFTVDTWKGMKSPFDILERK